MADKLEFIKTVDGATGTAAVGVDNAFNHGYDTYFVTVEGLTIDGNRSPFMRLLDSSGSEIVGSNYDRATFAINSSGGSNQYKNVNSSEWLYIPSLYINGPSGGDLNSFASFYVWNAEESSSYTMITAQGGDNVSHLSAVKTIAVLTTAGANRGFNFKYVSGTSNNFTGGTISIYGIKDS